MNLATTEEHKMVKVVRPAWSISAMVDCTTEYNGFVTHADYKALEEASAKLDADFWRVTKQNAKLIAELASIKARVGEGQ